MKTHVENGLIKLFNLRGQTIDMSDQAVFTLKFSGLPDEEGNKSNINDLLAATPRQSVIFFFRDDGPPRPGLSKMQAKSHELWGLYSTPTICIWDRFYH